MRAARAVVAGCILAAAAVGGASSTPAVPDVRLFFEAAGADESRARLALETITAGWRDGYAGLVLDLARFLPRASGGPEASTGASELPEPLDREEAGPPGRFGRFPSPPTAAAPVSPGARARARLLRFLEKETGQRFGDDLARWRRWLWNRPYEPHPDYALFKAVLYGQVDPRMAAFFPPGGGSLIRLDEVDWGGVAVNGIPPLDHPLDIPASAARYLDDDDIVFGIALGGEARAYPKRILAWHELARDRVGGVDLAIVYCTLCGTVVPYGAEVAGERRTFGTSGLLYRSNKLMFDEESNTLWSSAEGRPVIGSLVGRDLELTAHPVVTTRWGEWRRVHPETTVLSPQTGYKRDYSEGAAYRDYFATDRLMFGVPKADDRLKNKDEVLALLVRPPGAGADGERLPLALSARFLAAHPVHQLSFGGRDLVVVTSPGGANRVYDAGGRRFLRLAGDRLHDSEGTLWRVSEEALVSEDGSLPARPRIAARRAFWFGWYAQFPQTPLVR